MMSKRVANWYAKEVYNLAIKAGVYVATFSGGAIATYHDGICYVWYQTGFDGNIIQIIPKKSWL